MKYQYVLNNKILFETNSAEEYFNYLKTLEDKYIKDSVLYQLLVKNGGFIANMATTN